MENKPAPEKEPRESSARAETSSDRDFRQVCPNCGAILRDRSCKSRCPRCHFFTDCSDPW